MIPRSVRAALAASLVLSSSLHAQPRPVEAPLTHAVGGYRADAWQTLGLGAMRGATIGPIESSQHPGVGYGTEASGRSLDEMRALGCNWVSITPFGRLWDLQSTDIKLEFEAPLAANQAAVRRMVAQAHARGMRVLIIPHLWVETTGWRGEIGEKNVANDGPDAFTDAEWRRFFASYTRFVTTWARVAQASGAEMFSIGVELKSSSGTRGEWFDVIDAIRRVYQGMLTYSANWDEEIKVIFWDRLDVVGVQGFYPLAEHTNATLDELRSAARRRADRLEAWAVRNGQPVLFTEFGYTATPDPTLEPWAWPDGMQHPVVDERDQADGYRALMEAFIGRRWFVGGFVWRYYSDPMDSSQEAAWGFSPRLREGEQVLRDLYDPRVPWGADPTWWNPVRWDEDPAARLP